MNDEKLMALMNNLDDDLAEKEIDELMNDINCDVESIKKKAQQKLNKHVRKTKYKRFWPYAAAACACFLFINTVYADEISDVIKSFFNLTPVYSTTVDGQAYYLKDRIALDNDYSIDSCLVSDGRLEMTIISSKRLTDKDLQDLKIIPKNEVGIFYSMGGYSEEEDKYFFSFMNGSKENYDITPFKEFTLEMAGNSYDVTLDEGKNIGADSGVAVNAAASNSISWLKVGAKSIDKDGNKNIQMIVSFDNKNMELSSFGMPKEKECTDVMENVEDGSILGSSSNNGTKALYAVDASGNKYELLKPKDAKAYPVTEFNTKAPAGSDLTLNVPAIVLYDKNVKDSFQVNIPAEGESEIDRTVDLSAQETIVKSIKRVSPTTAVIEFALNTAGDPSVNIRSFSLYSKDIKKITTEFDGNKAIATLEFKEDLKTFDMEISWPYFVAKGNWNIDMK